MKTITIVIITALLCVAVLGCSETTPEEKIMSRLNDASGIVQVSGIDIDGETLEVSLKVPGYKDGQHFQDLMAYATIDIMPEARELAKEYGFNTVVITCLVGDDEGFQATILTSENVDWKSLENSKNLIQSIEPHTLKLYVNPAFK